MEKTHKNQPVKSTPPTPIAPTVTGILRYLPELCHLIKLTFIEWWRDNTPRYAAALAFYSLFSMAPVLLIAVGAASFFYVPALAAQDIVVRIQSVVGPQAAIAVGEVLRTSSGMGKSASAIVIGVATFIFGATVVFGELQAALNAIWDVRPNRRDGIMKAITNRFRSFVIALLAGALLVVSLLTDSVINHVKHYADRTVPGLGWFGQGAEAIVSFLVVVVLFAMIYKYLPDVRLGWRDVWLGATVTAILFVIGKYGIGIYLRHTTIATTFGAAGSLAVLLVWIYYSAMISFFGAEFTQVYARQRGKKIELEARAIHAGRKTPNPPRSSPRAAPPI